VGKRRTALEGVEVSAGDPLRGRRVLVTGHTGFKGSWLCLWLQSIGAEVAGYALDPPTSPNMFEAVGVASGMTDHRGDIRDTVSVQRFVERFNPEIVFHLAAQAIVREGYRDPVQTYATNVVGTAALLNACRRVEGVRAIVVVSSDKCYEHRNWTWAYREIDRLGGFDPYSSSKACTELVTDAFRRSYFAEKFVGLATARAGNVIGGGDWARDRLLPDLARAAINGEHVLIRNPAAVRPWQHVLEPIAGYLELTRRLFADAGKYAESWNFGPSPDSFQTVESVVKQVASCWDGKLAWTVDDASHPHEAARLLLDSSKAANALGWRARLGFDETVQLTADWYAAARAGQTGLRKLTQTQILSYAERVRRC